MTTRIEYSCPDCGGVNVIQSFPGWVSANDPTDKSDWAMDLNAQPSVTSRCLDCAENVVLRQQDIEIVQPACPNCGSRRISAMHMQKSVTEIVSWTEEDGEYQVDQIGKRVEHDEEFFAYACMACHRTLSRRAGDLRLSIAAVNAQRNAGRV
jgi:DNA-directed RNA polymerase subunit RPC12/RpoP